jgi:hypothetical protein
MLDDILEEAHRITHTDRNDDYGHRSTTTREPSRYSVYCRA